MFGIVILLGVSAALFAGDETFMGTLREIETSKFAARDAFVVRNILIQPKPEKITFSPAGVYVIGILDNYGHDLKKFEADALIKYLKNGEVAEEEKAALAGEIVEALFYYDGGKALTENLIEELTLEDYRLKINVTGGDPVTSLFNAVSTAADYIYYGREKLRADDERAAFNEASCVAASGGYENNGKITKGKTNLAAALINGYGEVYYPNYASAEFLLKIARSNVHRLIRHAALTNLSKANLDGAWAKEKPHIAGWLEGLYYCGEDLAKEVPAGSEHWQILNNETAYAYARVTTGRAENAVNGVMNGTGKTIRTYGVKASEDLKIHEQFFRAMGEGNPLKVYMNIVLAAQVYQGGAEAVKYFKEARQARAFVKNLAAEGIKEIEKERGILRGGTPVEIKTAEMVNGEELNTLFRRAGTRGEDLWRSGGNWTGGSNPIGGGITLRSPAVKTSARPVVHSINIAPKATVIMPQTTIRNHALVMGAGVKAAEEQAEKQRITMPQKDIDTMLTEAENNGFISKELSGKYYEMNRAQRERLKAIIKKKNPAKKTPAKKTPAKPGPRVFIPEVNPAPRDADISAYLEILKNNAAPAKMEGDSSFIPAMRCGLYFDMFAWGSGTGGYYYRGIRFNPNIPEAKENLRLLVENGSWLGYNGEPVNWHTQLVWPVEFAETGRGGGPYPKEPQSGIILVAEDYPYPNNGVSKFKERPDADKFYTSSAPVKPSAILYKNAKDGNYYVLWQGKPLPKTEDVLKKELQKNVDSPQYKIDIEPARAREILKGHRIIIFNGNPDELPLIKKKSRQYPDTEVFFFSDEDAVEEFVAKHNPQFSKAEDKPVNILVLSDYKPGSNFKWNKVYLPFLGETLFQTGKYDLSRIKKHLFRYSPVHYPEKMEFVPNAGWNRPEYDEGGRFIPPHAEDPFLYIAKFVKDNDVKPFPVK